ncbi:MAG: molybdenum cofactor guanylyltransferase [Halorientalis sp.]
MRRTSGVVVAGGRGSRFGDREKALVPVAGTPMLRRVADRLAAVADELVVNCRRDQRDAFASALAGLDPRFAHDTVPDRGPVHGVRTGLRVASGTYAVVLPCDMPFVDATLLAYLRNRARATDADAVAPRVGGTSQPLCAVYRVDPARAACERVVGQPEPRLLDLLAALDVDTVPEETAREYADGPAFANVNAPADLEALAAED